MRFIADALLPRLCPACGEETTSPLLCATCEVALYETENPCPRCALPRLSPSCPCRPHASALTTVSAPYLYGSELALTLQRLKYGRRDDIAAALGRWIQSELAAFCDRVGASWIVPVPSHWSSRLARGMDPILEILSGANTCIPVVRALRKTRRTKRQASLTRKERLLNLRGSLRVPKRYQPHVRQRSVVVFDDIITTMSTIKEAANTLVQAGCPQVFAFAIARSDGQT